MTIQENKLSKNLKIPAERCPVHRYHDLNKGLHNGTFELVAAMIREKLQGDQLQEQNTKVQHEGGEARSSEEVLVMRMERRGLLFQPIQIDNRKEGSKWKRQNHTIFLNTW